MYLIFFLILILFLSIFKITESFKSGFLVIESDTNNKDYLTFKIPIKKYVINDENVYKNIYSESEKNNNKIYEKKNKKETKGNTSNYTTPPPSIYSPEAQELLDDTKNNLLKLSSC